jgi:1-acyl-sn-glycerol-3-phosphate acyltransferase
VSVLRHVGAIVHSVWAWGGGFAWMLVAATLTVALRLVGIPYPRVHGWVTAPLFSSIVRWFANARVTIHYHPRFDPDVRSVFAQNHVNLMDGHLAARVIPHAFSGLMNAWQFWIPIYGWLMKLSMGIGVHSRGREKLIAELTAAAKERKRIGMSILTFPEGHRTLDGSVHTFRRGVFLMARNADMPMVPVAVRGYFAVNRKGSLLVHPFRKVDVYVGPQFPTTGLDDEEVSALAAELQAIVAHGVAHGGWPDSVDAGPSARAARAVAQ